MILPRLCLLAALAAGLFAQKKPVTIEAITATGGMEMAGPPVWAPDGKSFAYRQGRQLMLYDMAARTAKELLSTDVLTKAAATPPPAPRMRWENRGVREELVQWFPDGRDLLISAGRDLFIWHIATGKYDQLTATAAEERDPKLSPDARYVAFRRNHDLYALEISSRKETRLTNDGSDTLLNGETDWVYPEELDLGTAYWWSPDSRSIAYLQFDVSREPLYPQADLRGYRAVAEPERYPQAGDPNAEVQLGVVPVTGGATRWMDVGATTHLFLLARVEWMPDSRRLAVQRLTRVQDRLDLLDADVNTGQTRLLLRETDPKWINVRNDLRFLSDGKRFVWTSERDGYRHIYLYSNDGQQLRRLTSGPWEVRSIAGVDERTGRVYFLSSEASPTENQLYTVRFDGKDKTRLTRDAGWHTVSMAPSMDFFLDTWSNFQTPTRQVLCSVKGDQYAVFRESDRRVLDEYEYLPGEVVTIKAADGRTDLFGMITRPANFQSGRKYPAMVFVYGGPGAQRIRNQFGGLMGDSGLIQLLAQRGYVVWQLDNRGSTGRSHTFESAIYHSLGVTELADQKAGVDYLTSLGFVDPERIGIFGWSYGGFMTLNAMLHSPDTFRTGVAGAPVTNFVNYDTIYTERYMGLPADNVEGYKRTNLPLQAANLKGNLMVIHNFEDDNVLFQNTLQMVDALERAGKKFELKLYTQKTHGVTGPVRRQMLESIVDYLDRTLKF
jgi:dipeptidyl-peptidase-4